MELDLCGYKQIEQGVMINNNSFTHEECLFLVNILNEIFGIYTSLKKSNKI